MLMIKKLILYKINLYKAIRTILYNWYKINVLPTKGYTKDEKNIFQKIAL